MKVRVEGLKPILRRLEKLPDRAQRHAVRPAIRKAATPVVKTAKRLAPKGQETPQERKPLKKTITKSSVKLSKKTGTLYIFIGPEKDAPHSHLVHDGTKPHEIVLGKPAMIGNVVLPAGFIIKHPGAKANPFVDMAADAERGKVQSILAKEIVAGIEKQVQKLAKSK